MISEKELDELLKNKKYRLLGQIEVSDADFDDLIEYTQMKAKYLFVSSIPRPDLTVKQSFIKKIAESNKYKEWYHFGDIDPDGFYILEHLKKKTGISFKQLFMGIDELKKYRNYCKNLEDNDIKKAQSLIDKGLYLDTMRYMLENNVKLEQEVVSWKQSI